MATITHARESVVQALYAVEMGNEDAFSQLNDILENRKIRGKKAEFALNLLKGILENRDKIDEVIKSHLINWDFDRLDKIEKQILRVAIYEILYTDTPFQIVIDEAIKITKNFTEDNAKSYINGILDRVAKEKLNS